VDHARYMIMALTDTGTRYPTYETDNLLDAVGAVVADREDGDGSESFTIFDTETGRDVTRGDVRKAKAAQTAENLKIETAAVLAESKQARMDAYDRHPGLWARATR